MNYLGIISKLAKYFLLGDFHGTFVPNNFNSKFQWLAEAEQDFSDLGIDISIYSDA